MNGDIDRLTEAAWDVIVRCKVKDLASRKTAREIVIAILDTICTGNPIVPMRKGDVPREPGWYSARWKGNGNLSDLQVLRILDIHGILWVIRAETETGLMGLDQFSFIARIYPERITGWEQQP